MSSLADILGLQTVGPGPPGPPLGAVEAQLTQGHRELSAIPETAPRSQKSEGQVVAGWIPGKLISSRARGSLGGLCSVPQDSP